MAVGSAYDPTVKTVVVITVGSYADPALSVFCPTTPHWPWKWRCETLSSPVLEKLVVKMLLVKIISVVVVATP